MSDIKSGTLRSLVQKIESAWAVKADGASGGKKVRRVAVNLNHRKDRYTSGEIRDDRQKTRGSSGGERAEGTIDGELSCGSYQDFFEAQMCKAAAAIADLTGLTLTTDNNSGAGPFKIARASGDFLAAGMRAMTAFRVTAGLAAPGLNRNLLATAVDGDEITYFPLDGGGPLADESAVSACTISVPGKRIIVPSTGHIERSFTVEDLIGTDISRLFIGMELNTLGLDLSPGQNAKVSFGFMGHSMSDVNGAAYFASPAALTSTPALAGPKGLVLIDGEVQAVITQLTGNLNANLSTEAVIGSTAAPAIGQGSIVGSGQATILLKNRDFIDRFKDDTPFEIVTFLRESAAPNSHFMLFGFPECQANSADLDDGEKLLKQTIPFDFTKKTAAVGYDETTFIAQDTRYA